MLIQIHLKCFDMRQILTRDKRMVWVGYAFLDHFATSVRIGPIRRSVRAARRDAERLAIELLCDIRDGTKALLTSHGIGESD